MIVPHPVSPTRAIEKRKQDNPCFSFSINNRVSTCGDMSWFKLLKSEDKKTNLGRAREGPWGHNDAGTFFFFFIETQRKLVKLFSLDRTKNTTTAENLQPRTHFLQSDSLGSNPVSAKHIASHVWFTLSNPQFPPLCSGDGNNDMCR